MRLTSALTVEPDRLDLSLHHYNSEPGAEPWSPVATWRDAAAGAASPAATPRRVAAVASSVKSSTGSSVSGRTRDAGRTDARAVRRPVSSVTVPVPSLTLSRTTISTGGPRSPSGSVLLNRQTYGFTSLSEAEVEETGSERHAHPGPEDEDPSSTTFFPCPFHFIRCERRFADETQWRTHTASHFHMRGFPTHVACPLRDCNALDATFDDSAEAWQARMVHMAAHHRAGQGLVLRNLCDRAKERSLHEHLWSIGLLDPLDRKDLMANGTLAGTAGTYSIPEDRHSRRRPATGQWGRVR